MIVRKLSGMPSSTGRDLMLSLVMPEDKIRNELGIEPGFVTAQDMHTLLLAGYVAKLERRIAWLEGKK